MIIKGKRDTFRAALIQQTAEKTGFSKRYVRYVLENDRRNENVMSVYMTLLEGTNHLIREVERIVPFEGRDTIRANKRRNSK